VKEMKNLLFQISTKLRQITHTCITANARWSAVVSSDGAAVEASVDCTSNEVCDAGHRYLHEVE
jgi:hypothetical protein